LGILRILKIVFTHNDSSRLAIELLVY
jgi:hypothetical protein